MKKLILFDIDYTIFDTDLYRELFYPRLAAAIGYDIEEFKLLAKQAVSHTGEKLGHFSPEVFLSFLVDHAKKHVTLQELEAIFWDTDLYRSSLEKGVGDVIQILQQRNMIVGVLSTGNKKHQLKKIEMIKDFLDDEHIHIFGNKIVELENVLAKYPDYQLYVVDDLLTVLSAAKELSPHVTTIWRKRDKIYEKTDMVENFTPDHTISHVDQILTFLS